MNSNCDFSPMKQQLTEGIQHITQELQHSLSILGDENYCLLGNFEKIKEQFIQMESLAASFYLNCYLSSFTDKYIELSICAQNLSTRHHGALIVVERQESLDDIIQKGTYIGATLSPPLLESIFYPGNPLHDGAVLVRENQLCPQQMYFPLQKQ